MICTKCRKSARVVMKFFDEQLNNALHIAGDIVNEVAKVIDNPLFELLISQLPASVNVEACIKVIEDVLVKTSAIAKCEGLTGIEKVNCLMKGLNLLPKDERNSALLRLKSELTQLLDGNRYEKYVYDTSGQLEYFNRKIEAGSPIKKDGQEFVQNETVVQVAEEQLRKSQAEYNHAMPIEQAPTVPPPAPQAF